MTVINHLKRLMQEKSEREQRPITNMTLTDELNMSHNTIYSWARGGLTRYDADVISKFCAYFNCTIADLLEYIPDDD